MAAAVLVLFFPANIYAAINHIPMGGHAWGPVYRLFAARTTAACNPAMGLLVHAPPA